MKGMFLSILFFCSFTFIGNCTDSLFQKGIEEMVKGNYQKAQKTFQRDILNDPSYSNYYNLGFTAGNIGDWNKAKWAYESALKYEPLNEDVQYNAKFATQKLNKSQVWNHPYPVYQQVVIGFGSITWIILAIFFSLCVGLFLYIILSRNNKNSGLTRWSLRLIIPALFLFVVSFFCVYSINDHFNHQRFAILKDNNSKFYLSPNGVEANYNIDPSRRLQILKYAKDSTWVQLESQKNIILWIKSKEIYSY